MIIRMLGDVHGKYRQYKRILKESPYPVLQLGDLGIGFMKRDPITFELKSDINPPYDLMVKSNARFLRGNHDSPSVCRKHTQWISDGHTETIGSSKVMFVGGGLSIDKHMPHRIEGETWWADEELSISEFYEITDKYVKYKPDIMITHDCPDEIASIVFGVTNKGQYPSRTRQALQAMFEIHQPRCWIHGHWHLSAQYTVNGTTSGA